MEGRSSIPILMNKPIPINPQVELNGLKTYNIPHYIYIFCHILNAKNYNKSHINSYFFLNFQPISFILVVSTQNNTLSRCTIFKNEIFLLFLPQFV